MSDFHDEEVLRAGTSGFFKLHSLITHIESLGDMQPAFTDEDYTPPADVVALHVHEYIHYLHNLTTRAGLNTLKDVFFLVQPLLIQKFNDKLGLGVDRNIKNHLRMAFNSMRLSNGYVEGVPKGFKWKPVKAWEFTQVVGKEVPLPEILVDPEQQVLFHVIALFHDGSKLEFCLMPGFEFITEGIAYEIERDIRKKAGAIETQLDANTPSYPYLAYAPLIEHLAGVEIPSDERIFIGSLALLAPSPSVALTSLGKLKGNGEGTVGAAMLTPIVHDILDTFSTYADNFCKTFIPLLYRVFSSSGILTKGMEVYEQLIRKGIASRRERSCLELSFIRESISADEFNNISAHLLDRLVFQGKPGSESEISWSGAEGGIASMTTDIHAAFATLQACIHYVQHHLVSDGFETIKPLRSTPCPFRGACSVEESSEFPDVCKQRPWEARASGKVKQLCVYQLGVDEFNALSYEVESSAEGDGELPF